MTIKSSVLNRLILGSEAVDAGHRGSPLLLAVNHVIIILITDGLEGDGIDPRMHEGLIAYCLHIFMGKRRVGIPTHRPDPASLVITRHPAVSMDRVARLIGDYGVAGNQKLSQPPIIAVFFGFSAHSNDQAVVRLLYSEPWGLIQQMIFRS